MTTLHDGHRPAGLGADDGGDGRLVTACCIPPPPDPVRALARGPWALNLRRLTLRHRAIGYEIDLCKASTSAGALDLVMQVANKTWADDATLAALVRALDDLLCPQATLCGCGVDRGPIDVRATIRQRRLALASDQQRWRTHRTVGRCGALTAPWDGDRSDGNT